jgi:hypothetical protein
MRESIYIEMKLWWITDASKHNFYNKYTLIPKLVYKCIWTVQVLYIHQGKGRREGKNLELLVLLTRTLKTEDDVIWYFFKIFRWMHLLLMPSLSRSSSLYVSFSVYAYFPSFSPSTVFLSISLILPLFDILFSFIFL